jgi:hypothetical protein
MCSRIARAFIGFIYLFLAYKAARVLLAGRAGTADTQDHARDVLDLPGGDIVLGVAALVMLIAGLNQLRKAWECEFLNRLNEGAGQQSWVKWFGRLGYAARGVIFLVVGYLRAGLSKRLIFFHRPWNPPLPPGSSFSASLAWWRPDIAESIGRRSSALSRKFGRRSRGEALHRVNGAAIARPPGYRRARP